MRFEVFTAAFIQIVTFCTMKPLAANFSDRIAASVFTVKMTREIMMYFVKAGCKKFPVVFYAILLTRAIDVPCIYNLSHSYPAHFDNEPGHSTF